MPKLHGAECIRDEVVWFCHCVCYPDGWLMSVWEFVHVLYHYSCGLWSSVQRFVSGRYGRSGDVRLYCRVLGLRPEYYVTVPPMMCSPVRCTPSWFQVIALLYHRDQRILSAVVLNLRRCRVVSSHYSIILFYHRARSVAFGSHSYITNSYSSTYILLRGWSLRAELKSSWVSAYSFGPLKCQIHECSHLCSHQDQALVLKTSEYLAAGSIWFRAVNRWA